MLQLNSGTIVRGELLAASDDTLWLLAGAAQLAGYSFRDIRDVWITRHSMTAASGIAWGIAVGLLSGIGLSKACNEVSDGCGDVLLGSLAGGLVWGGLAAISLERSSRQRIRPVTAAELAPYCRFPQGPPARLDSLLMAPRATTGGSRR